MASLGSAYVYWKFLGLCPFVFVDDDAIRISHSGTIYAIFLVIIYTFCYLRAVTNRTTFRLPRETPMSIIADFGGLSVEFSLIVLSWLCFGFRQNRARKILMFFKKIHKTYENIGMDEENSKLFKEVNIHTIIINFVWYFLCAVDHLLICNSPLFNLGVWVPFNTPRVVSHNIMVMFTDTMRAIERRFTLLNEKIEDLRNEVSTRVIVRQPSSRKGPNGSGFGSFITPGPLETYGQIHSDLIDLANIVVEFYSLSILLIVITHFIQMSSGLYTMCLVVKDRTIWPWRDVGSFLILCSWFLLHFGEMTILVAVSDSTTRKANQAGNSLHKMLLASRTDRYADSAKILSLQLWQRQLSVNLYGLLQMRLSVIYQIMSMVATYITVMVQLDGQEAHVKEWK